MAHDVFVSYSQEDKPVADAVVAHLEQKGIRSWIAPRDITPGSSWGEAIVDAIGGSRVMVLVLSANSNRSKQVIREVERAVASDVTILPFRIENMDPTGAMAYFLGTEHWLDALTPPLEKHIERLGRTVGTLVTGEPVPREDLDKPPAALARTRRRSWLPAALIGGATAVAAVAATLAITLGGGSSIDSEVGEPPATTGEPAANDDADTVPGGSAMPEEMAGAVDFEDQFDGALEDGWEWLLEDPDAWSLTAVLGWLEITAVDVEQNLLLRDAPDGDYEVITALRFRPTSNFQFAGLTVGPTGDNVTFLQLGRAYCDPDIPGCVGDGVYFDDVKDGELIGNAIAGIAAETDVLYLRIVFDSDAYLAYASEDGETWSLLGEHVGSFGDDRIGIIAHQAFEEPAVAEFDYVTVSSPPTLGLLPSFEEVTAAYPQGPTCDTKADVIGENSDGSLRIRFPPGTALFDDRVEFPCWGMRLTVLVDLDQQGTRYLAGSVLVVGPGSDPALLVDETGSRTSAAVGTFIDTWTPPDGLSLVIIEP